MSFMTSISFFDSSPTRARPLDPPSAGRISLALDRLAVVGTVLYVAAHPDDENTRLLAYLANGRGLRTIYLAMTRGDGGQNLVGSDLGPLLGLIRTHELLAARAVDGAEQLFSRAIDFGYSKSSEETLRIWGKDEVLADVVRVMDRVEPDVVMTRFSPEPPNHGHHMASAILARDAFSKAKRRPARLFENKSSWRMKEGEDTSKYLRLDVGGYAPELGESYADLAARSRTNHKSQGFGTATSLGTSVELFEPTLPDQWPEPMPKDTQDPLAGLDLTWARFPKTEAIRAAIATARKAFDARHPEALVPLLVAIDTAIGKLPTTNPYRAQKLAEVEALLVACLGLDLDVRATTPTAIAGEPLALEATAITRLPTSVSVGVTFPDGDTTQAQALTFNTVDKRAHTMTIARDAPSSTPYWLRLPPSGGLFTIPEHWDPNDPVAAPDLQATFDVHVGAFAFTATRPVRYAWTDQVNGERFRAVEILPAVTITPDLRVRMFPNGQTSPVTARIRAHGAARSGVVKLEVPTGWKVAPASQTFALAADGDTSVSFDVTPTGDGKSEIKWVATVAGARFDQAERVIDYLHVPRTTVLSPATIRAVPLAIQLGRKRVAYIPGAGDDIAQALAQVGYQVTTIEAAALADADLTRFDAVIAGIRAYNVHGPELVAAQAKLRQFMEAGGTYLVQYVTSNRQKKLDIAIGPYPLTIEQGRVTDETAAMTVTNPASPLVQAPNKIGPADFVGWVQERGLYFADTWDPKYSTLFSAFDPGEKPLEGSVLSTRVGMGAFVYTGLAFFRQLPEGVAGAYRLFANLLASEVRK